jgi:hypothetical protein
MPSAVRAQEAKAEKALEELEAIRSGKPASELDTSVETKTNTLDTFAEPTKQQVVPPAAPQGEIKKGEGDAELKDLVTKLTAKFDVLQGKYNSEVPRLNGQIKSLETQNDTLKDELDEANAKPVVADPSAYKKYLTPEEQEELDPQVADLQQRMSKGVAEDAAKRTADVMKGEVGNLKETIANLKQSQAEAAEAVFWGKVETLAPGITDANTNSDDKWSTFLDGTDSVSRLTYRSIGEAAVGRHDADAVANLFNLFKGQTVEKKQQVTAASQVKPVTVSQAPNTESAAQGPEILQSEVEKFYRDAVKNKLSEAEISKKEAEFELAVNEGRMVFGK